MPAEHAIKLLFCFQLPSNKLQELEAGKNGEVPIPDVKEITYPSPFTKLRNHAAQQLSALQEQKTTQLVLAVHSDELKAAETCASTLISTEYVKPKPSETTIKASQQQIIDRIVDKLCFLPEQSSPTSFNETGMLDPPPDSPTSETNQSDSQSSPTIFNPEPNVPLNPNWNATRFSEYELQMNNNVYKPSDEHLSNVVKSKGTKIFNSSLNCVSNHSEMVLKADTTMEPDCGKEIKVESKAELKSNYNWSNKTYRSDMKHKINQSLGCEIEDHPSIKTNIISTTPNDSTNQSSLMKKEMVSHEEHSCKKPFAESALGDDDLLCDENLLDSTFEEEIVETNGQTTLHFNTALTVLTEVPLLLSTSTDQVSNHRAEETVVRTYNVHVANQYNIINVIFSWMYVPVLGSSML